MIMKNIHAWLGVGTHQEILEYDSFIFSGGEIQVRGKNWPVHIYKVLPVQITIEANLRSSNDIMTLFCLTNALKQHFYGNVAIELVMPYLPYARQDRICYPGEAFSLQMFCQLINAQNYKLVTIWDCHSDVGVALLNNVLNVTQSNLLRNFTNLPDDYVLVAPDAGAVKKCLDCAKYLERPMVNASKVRDPNTGEITRTTIDFSGLDRSNGRKWLIVDDICDGGRTFTELAKTLYNQVSHNGIYLYVTHGIFSKGFDVFREEQTFGCPGPLIKHIYVANSFVDDVPDFVTTLQGTNK